MHRMRVPLRHTSVPVLGLGQLKFLLQRMYLGVLFTLAFRNACTRKLFVTVFGDSLLGYNFGVQFIRFLLFSIGVHLGVLRPYTWFTSSFRPSEFCRLTSFRVWSIAGPVIRSFPWV